MLNLPNTITLTRIALVVVFTAVISLAAQHPWGYPAALIVFVLAACTDWLDGYLARRLNQVTTFGKLIDPLADKIAVSAAFIYLTAAGLCPFWVTIIIISREFLSPACARSPRTTESSFPQEPPENGKRPSNWPSASAACWR